MIKESVIAELQKIVGKDNVKTGKSSQGLFYDGTTSWQQSLM